MVCKQCGTPQAAHAGSGLLSKEAGAARGGMSLLPRAAPRILILHGS